MKKNSRLLSKAKAIRMRVAAKIKRETVDIEIDESIDRSTPGGRLRIGGVTFGPKKLPDDRGIIRDENEPLPRRVRNETTST